MANIEPIPMQTPKNSTKMSIRMFSIISFETERIFSVFLSAFLWLTPIVYSNKVKFDLLKQLNYYNPLTYLLCSPRDVVLSGKLYGPESFFLFTGLFWQRIGDSVHG